MDDTRRILFVSFQWIRSLPGGGPPLVCEVNAHLERTLKMCEGNRSKRRKLKICLRWKRKFLKVPLQFCFHLSHLFFSAISPTTRDSFLIHGLKDSFKTAAVVYGQLIHH